MVQRACAAGYRVSSTHANPLGIKTDAPFNVIWDIIRCWVQDHPVKGHDADSYGKSATPYLPNPDTISLMFGGACGAVIQPAPACFNKVC